MGGLAAAGVAGDEDELVGGDGGHDLFLFLVDGEVTDRSIHP